MTDTDRYVEVECRMCGWMHLIAPRERDHPCDAVASCAGTVSDPEDRTFECVPRGFKSRVAALLKRIEHGNQGHCPVDIGNSECPASRYSTDPHKHHPACELAVLLRECGA